MSTPPHTLVIDRLNAGFFANFNNVVAILAHQLGEDGAAAARVDWRVRAGDSDFPYGPVGCNAWDQFFEPLRFADPPAAERPARNFPDPNLCTFRPYWLYKCDRTWRRRYHAVAREHVRLTPRLRERVAALRAGMAGRPVVGVHARSPAHSVENIFPIPRTAYFIARARQLLAETDNGLIFLATDTAATAQAFAAAFGDRLVLQPDVQRATAEGVQVHQHHPLPDQDLGEQVLVDCLLLASCDVLLHVTSGVATAAGYLNPDLRMVYCEPPAGALVGGSLARLLGPRNLRWVRPLGRQVWRLQRWRDARSQPEYRR